MVFSLVAIPVSKYLSPALLVVLTIPRRSSSVKTHINGDVAQLWPAEGVVHVVLAEVVLRQICDVGLLDVRNV